MNKHSARLSAAFHGRKRVKKLAADFLLIDVSNSFTKLAFASRSRIGRPSKIPTPTLTAEGIARILQGRDASNVVVSSVVPKKNREIKRAAGNRNLIWLTSRSRLNVRIDYPNPKTIGADRLANAVAAAKLYGTPAIVIDFGTAVTFDIVAPDKAYIGGVIAPGLEAMTNFLYDRTALLPRISLREPRSAIGKSTNQAMLAGAIFGYRGLVREILQRITAEKSWKGKTWVVATGGYAKLIARKLPEVETVHANLTLEGLRLVGCMNSSRGALTDISTWQ
jgi:type III pantothenate kinase